MGAAADLAENLRAMAKAIKALPQAQRFTDLWGWQGLPIDKTDLSYGANIIVELVESVDWSGASDDANHILTELAAHVDVATRTVVPQLFSGGPTAATGIVALLQLAEQQIRNVIVDDQLRGTLRLPVALKRNVAVAEQRLQGATASLDGIEAKIEQINRASDAADRLPVTLHDLEIALAQIEATKSAATRSETAAAASAKVASEAETQMRAAVEAAEDVMKKISAAYRAVTSQGLAQAFAEKSRSLEKSMLLWAFVLIGALLAAGLLAADRFPSILAAIGQKPDWGVATVNVVLGALSLAPPVWLAWVSTKQIGQRFRLAEDYGYKAALSAAYEGYRSEAAQLDSMFQAQLFATALGHLDELPLRLVERDVHGSPLHELINSAEFKEASEAVPALKERLMALLRRGKGQSDAEAPKGSAAS